MSKIDPTWKIFFSYLLIILLILVSNRIFSQVKIIEFNASWNQSNQVKWIKDLTDCEKDFIDIGKDIESQKKFAVVVVPTIIIFNDDEEIKRFQADLSFKMIATKEEVQEVIDEQLMSDF